MGTHAKKEPKEQPKAVDRSHCWDPVLDSGGTVPFCIPLDPEDKGPFRMISVTRKEQLFVHYKCCQCGVSGTRRWKTVNVKNHADHGGHHDAFDYPEVESLPTGDCPGVAT